MGLYKGLLAKSPWNRNRIGPRMLTLIAARQLSLRINAFGRSSLRRLPPRLNEIGGATC